MTGKKLDYRQVLIYRLLTDRYQTVEAVEAQFKQLDRFRMLSPVTVRANLEMLASEYYAERSKDGNSFRRGWIAPEQFSPLFKAVLRTILKKENLNPKIFQPPK